MEGCCGRRRSRPASPRGTVKRERDEVEAVRPDPQGAGQAETFELLAAAGIDPDDDHVSVDEVHRVEGLATGGGGGDPAGGLDRAADRS